MTSLTNRLISLNEFGGISLRPERLRLAMWAG